MILHPFNYYAHAASKPRLCELDESGFVYWQDNDIVKHRKVYGGVFVPLVEQPAPPPPIDWQTPVVVHPPATEPTL